MMAGQAANTTSLMGMTLMTEPLHNQVSTVNLCMCMFMCVNGHVMWAVSVSVLLYLILLLVHITCHVHVTCLCSVTLPDDVQPHTM